MSERNEVRVSDSDAEMLAIKAIASALDRLDEAARKRVLEWGEDRYVNAPLKRMSDAAMEGMTRQLEVLDRHATQLGVKTTDLVHAYSTLRQRSGFAPVDERELDPREVEQAERKLANR